MAVAHLLVAILLAQVCLGGQFISYSYQGRNNMLYVPSASGTAPLPVFVMLHGCTQNPTDFAAGTNMNQYGEQYKFFVLYPEQPSSANQNKCWNWFEPQHQSRGAGEPALISSMALSLSSKYTIDNTSIFVGGLSAGAAMAAIMGVTYPDVFRGTAVGAGLEYEAATSVISALTAMREGGPSPTTQGLVAYKEMGRYAATLKVLVTQGTADYTVYPVNGQQVVAQYAKTLDYVLGGGQSKGYITNSPTTTTQGQVPSGRAYTTYTYADSQTGETLIEYITITGMGHAWSGGSSSGSYTDPTGPNASLLMVQFFLLNNTNPTTTTTAAVTSASITTAATTRVSATITSATTTASSTSASATSASATTSVSSTASSSSATSTTGSQGQTFTSINGEDGFVGSTPYYGSSTSVCKIGDVTGARDNFRAIISFDTSSLSGSPSGAQLTITRQSLAGSLTPLVVDIKQGSFGSTLTQMDYYATPSASDIGLIGIPSSDGSTVTFQIPSSALQYITSGSRTQFMLRENMATTPINLSANSLQIGCGKSTLTVTF